MMRFERDMAEIVQRGPQVDRSSDEKHAIILLLSQSGFFFKLFHSSH